MTRRRLATTLATIVLAATTLSLKPTHPADTCEARLSDAEVHRYLERDLRVLLPRLQVGSPNACSTLKEQYPHAQGVGVHYVDGKESYTVAVSPSSQSHP